MLDGYGEAKVCFDLKKLPAHFLLEMKPLTTHQVTGQELAHLIKVALKLPYTFQVIPRHWDSLVRKFQPITDATVNSALHTIFTMLVTNSYLDQNGLVRAGAYILVTIDYEKFSNLEAERRASKTEQQRRSRQNRQQTKRVQGFIKFFNELHDRVSVSCR